MKAIRNSIGQRFARLDNFRILLSAAVLVALLAPAARASDPTGIYGFVDRVVFEPSDAAQERIQIWGGFALAKRENRNDYHDAERGYLYFKLRPGEEAVCKKEWADLKSIAGTRQVVAFGSRSEQPAPKLRKADAKAAEPDVHPKSVGITKIQKRDYAPITQLEKLMSETSGSKESSAAKDAPKAGNK
jgi:hypothetical protein